MSGRVPSDQFLSSNAQDFIEDYLIATNDYDFDIFLSSNAQDFIEETMRPRPLPQLPVIPEQ